MDNYTTVIAITKYNYTYKRMIDITDKRQTWTTLLVDKLSPYHRITDMTDKRPTCGQPY
jgi:hypothetical protein